MNRREVLIGAATASAVTLTPALASIETRSVDQRVNDLVDHVYLTVKDWPNDRVTRAVVHRMLDLGLYHILGPSYTARGLIYEHRCDARNNPPSVIDSGGLIIDIHYRSSVDESFKVVRWSFPREV